jgi:hypothetical protein
METHFQNIVLSLDFLKEVIKLRLDEYFKPGERKPFQYPDLTMQGDDSPMSQFIVEHQLNIEEYTILLLALVPHIHPNFIDNIVQGYLPTGGDFPEIGGAKTNQHRGTIPTGETILFILAGNDMYKRMLVSHYFSGDHFFAKENVLTLENLQEGEPRMSGKIILQQEFVELFTLGTSPKPVFSPDFPAKHITTKMEWSDLVLNAKTMQQIHDIKIWLDYNDALMQDWGMVRKIKPGYRALFHGPPGTGKTLTATLLGKQFNKDVFRIDLSQVVSKYIGETEKNLEKVFARADRKDWILFFDEADALFGKRSNVQNAHDKYANQETSYLLQRVEDFPGLIILASNFKSNIDQAFIRRFNTIIQFPIPTPLERLEIWKSSIPTKAALAPDVDLATIAHRYELSGSSIISVIHFASLQTLHRNSKTILRSDLVEGIRREYEKEEKVFAG